VLKVVVDTNQFVSSLITRKGPPAGLLQAWREHTYILITSTEILEEVARVLRYPRIARKYSLREEDIKSFLNLIEHEAVILPETIKINVIKDDPDDNKVLACALEAQAQYIVSGDNHLLNLRQYKDIAIVTVREFLKTINFKI